MNKAILVLSLVATPLLALAASTDKSVEKQPPLVEEKATLSDTQFNSLVKHSLRSCKAIHGENISNDETTSNRLITTRVRKEALISPEHRREVSTARVEKTLHGVWRGEVLGDHGEVNVDYFWIMDLKRDEALIIGQRSGFQTLADAEPIKNAPQISYLMCGHEGYDPGVATPQVHVFTKVSNSIADAEEIVSTATGVRFPQRSPTLADMWDELVKTDYFDTLVDVVAFGGGFFKPLRIQNVPVANGGVSELSMNWDAEYRGGGETLLKFTKAIPMVGSEQAQFVATGTSDGDYLVASPGNGNIWKVEVVAGGQYDLAFDSVSMGPLQD